MRTHSRGAPTCAPLSATASSATRPINGAPTCAPLSTGRPMESVSKCLTLPKPYHDPESASSGPPKVDLIDSRSAVGWGESSNPINRVHRWGSRTHPILRKLSLFRERFCCNRSLFFPIVIACAQILREPINQLPSQQFAIPRHLSDSTSSSCLTTSFKSLKLYY